MPRSKFKEPTIDPKSPVDGDREPTNGQFLDSRPRAEQEFRPRARRSAGKGPASPPSLASDNDFLAEAVAELKDKLAAENRDEGTSSQKTTDDTAPDSQAAEKQPQTVPIAQIAANLRDGPVILALRAAGLGRDVPVEAWRLALEDFLQRAGNPDDPIERVLVEEIELAHQAVCRLYVRAASGTDSSSQICFEALAKLVAEIPRLVSALSEYRSAASLRNVGVVGQPSRAPAADQPTANLDRGHEPPRQHAVIDNPAEAAKLRPAKESEATG